MSAAWITAPRPLFACLVDDMVEQIRDGRPRPGDRLPSVRGLAVHYGVAHVTALRAMRELQVFGTTYGVAGRGTFVRPDAVARLHAQAFSRDCDRCADEAAYTKHLVTAIERCHRLADQLGAHPSGEVAAVAADLRRLASILAGGLMDHAHHLDRSDERHRHDEHHEYDDCD